MRKIVGVYNANSGFWGELNYMVCKVTKKSHCSLCDITNGKFSAKSEWLDLVEKFPIKIETVHINEMDDITKKAVGDNTPCVVYIEDDNRKIIMNEEELDSCGKNPEEFFNLLKKKLDSEGISYN